MRGEDPWATPDPLGEALHVLRMSGTFYCRSELTAPWGLDLPPEPESMWFHVVNAGRCWLEVDGDEPRQLQPGDFALVPHGEGHLLRSEPGAPAPRVDGLDYDYASDRYAILRYGGGGAPRTSCAAPSASGTRQPATWWRCCPARSSSRGRRGRRHPRPTGCTARSG